jgi:hypothetical protein
VANPYQRPGFKDPRETAQESASTLSSYFQDKAAKKAGGTSVYSAPAGDAAGTAPMGGGSAGGPSAPSAPKGSAGGGTGFVSFGQYFGANAPAIQQSAQQAVTKAAAPQGQPKTVMAGQSPYEAQIAQTSAQFAALNPAAQSGDMGENVSAFDQLLGGGVTQRAAKQEQQRLGTLRAALEGQQNQWTVEQAARKEAQDRQQAQSAKARQQEQEQAQRTQDAALVSAKDLAYREADSAGVIQMFHSRDSWWNSLSDAEKQKYLDQTTTGRGTGQFGESEYGSVSQ